MNGTAWARDYHQRMAINPTHGQLNDMHCYDLRYARQRQTENELRVISVYGRYQKQYEEQMGMD